MSTKEQYLSNEILRFTSFLRDQTGALNTLGMESSPVYAATILDKVGPMLKAATLVQVYSQVLKVLQRDGETATQTYLEGRIFHGARNPLRSTNPMANFQNTLELEYLARALDIIKPAVPHAVVHH